MPNQIYGKYVSVSVSVYILKGNAGTHIHDIIPQIIHKRMVVISNKNESN